MCKGNYWLIVIFLAVFGLFSSGSFIDFHRLYDEAEAERIFHQGEYEKAQQSFEELADTAPDGVERSKWLARSAIALAHQEEQFEKGMERAKKVEHRPYSVYAQMQLMSIKDDYEALIEAFKDEPIEEWPPYEVPAPPRGSAEDVRAYAFADRGQAYSETGDFAKAEKDIMRAADLIKGARFKVSTLRTLVQLRSRLDDPEGVFKANMMIYEVGSGGASYYRGLLGAANHLRQQGDYEQALEMIERMNPYQQRGWWHGASLNALGQTLADAGRTEEALKAYRAVVENEDNHRNHRSPAYLRLAETLAENGELEQAVETYRSMLKDGNLRTEYTEQARKALEELGETLED